MKFPTLDEEVFLWRKGYKDVCGIDEVGRGCFAGPVVVGAVIFDNDSTLPVGINDSKLLNYKVRRRLSEEIKRSCKSWKIVEVGVEVINKVGIGKATQQAFFQVIQQVRPDFILSDAFLIQGIDQSMQKPIIKGDSKSISIAAASIIAKVYRDELMEKLDLDFPEYGFSKHKGYGTKLHQDRLKQFGLSKLHRRSFNLKRFL